MTNKGLQEYLQRFPDDWKVVLQGHNVYDDSVRIIEEEDIELLNRETKFYVSAVYDEDKEFWEPTDKKDYYRVAQNLIKIGEGL